MLRARHKLVLATALWALTVASGFAILLQHSAQPGQQAVAHTQWPAGSTLKPYKNTSTLLMFVHPHCPCTRASLNELSKLMARCTGKVKATVVFFRPANTDADWARTDNWYSACSIPGVAAVADKDGRERKIFGAFTSGEVLLYNKEGILLFHGGITSGRGHEGDNLGSTSIQSILKKGSACAEPTSTNTFGCPLSRSPLR